MTKSRRRRGFERAGAVPAKSLGLPARRARELALLTAWERLAGRQLAQHVRAVAVRRGVLELVAAEPAWLRAVADLAGGLAARLAEAEPGLGIRRWRLGLASAAEPPAAQPLPPASEAVAPETARPSRRRRAAAGPPAAEANPEPLEPRLGRLAERYLARQGNQKT